MAYMADFYSKCIVQDVKGYLARERSRRVVFNARLSEVNPIPGSLTDCTFVAEGWFYRVNAFVHLQRDQAIDWQNQLKDWALSRTKVRIEGTTRPEPKHRYVLVKTITGIIEETIKGEIQQEPSPLVGMKVDVWKSPTEK